MFATGANALLAIMAFANSFTARFSHDDCTYPESRTARDKTVRDHIPANQGRGTLARRIESMRRMA